MRWLPTRRDRGRERRGRLGAHRIELDAAELVQPIEQGGSCKGVAVPDGDRANARVGAHALDACPRRERGLEGEGVGRAKVIGKRKAQPPRHLVFDDVSHGRAYALAGTVSAAVSDALSSSSSTL